MTHEVSTSMSWEWLVGLGAFLIIFGVVALAAPVATSVGLGWLLGALFIASGIAQLIHALRTLKESGRVGRILLAAFSLIAGAVTLRNPLIGTMGITLVMAFYLMTAALGKMMIVMEVRHLKGSGWGWILLSSVASLILGVILLVTFPANSLIVPGIFLGVDLIFYGISLIAFSLALYRVSRQTLAEVGERRKAA